jgi:DNA repair protein RadC
MKKNEFPLARVAEIKLSYHPNFKAAERPKISESKQVYKVLIENWDLGLIGLQEQFKIVLLSRANRVALKAGACGIILAHNHPSGNLTASRADMDLTAKLCAGAKLLDIEIFDHLIITVDGYLSLAEEKLM